VSAIADLAEAAAPARYDRLVVEADFEELDATGVRAYALTDDARIPLDVGFDVLDVFEEIYRIFQEGDHPAWNGATLTVTGEGEATVRFRYSD
jgi:hypothetical protein